MLHRFFQLPKRFSEDHEAQEARDAALEKERLVRRREEDELKAIISASEMSSDQQQLAAKSEEKSTEDFSTPPSRYDDEVDLDAAAERAAAAIAAARSSGAGQSPETALPAGSGHSPSQWEPFDAMIDEWDTEAGAVLVPKILNHIRYSAPCCVSHIGAVLRAVRVLVSYTRSVWCLTAEVYNV
jgi:hypothetical protein